MIVSGWETFESLDTVLARNSFRGGPEPFFLAGSFARIARSHPCRTGAGTPAPLRIHPGSRRTPHAPLRLPAKTLDSRAGA